MALLTNDNQQQLETLLVTEKVMTSDALEQHRQTAQKKKAYRSSLNSSIANPSPTKS